MRTNELPLLAILLAVIFGVQIPIARRQATPPPSAKGTSTSEAHTATLATTQKKSRQQKTQAKSQRLGQPLCRLSKAEIFRDIASSDASKSTQRAFPACLEKGIKITSVIASVPDPLHSHLGLVFDRTLDAIQAAAASHSYLLYRTIHLGRAQHGDSEPVAPVRESAGNPPPDVLVFHKADTQGKVGGQAKADPQLPTDYLTVFLVPESPTAGIDWPIFFQARDLVEAIDKRYQPAPPPKRPLWFAGPLFSGSVSGLIEVNQEHSAKHGWIQACSGTVTNFGVGGSGECKGDIQSGPQFLQTNDAEAIFLIADKLGYRMNEIAVLTEEGTEYGRLAEHPRFPKWKEKHPEDPGVLFLHFPREISRLRNAYGTDTPESNLSSGQLPLNWRDSRSVTGDNVHSFGDPQTALSEEAVLASLAASVKARGIRLLGILGTDPWDVTFLVHSFKESCPGVRLFAREADLLYQRTSDVGMLNGVLIVNDFPLIRQNQSWTSDKGRTQLISFASGAQEAQYNAFGILLAAALKADQSQTPLLEVGWPHGKPTTGEPFNKRQPLWLASTGTTGYYPVAILDRDRAESIDQAASEQPDADQKAGSNQQTVSGEIVAPEQNAGAIQEELYLHGLDVGRPPVFAILVWASFALVASMHAVCLFFPKLVPAVLKEEFDFRDDEHAVSKAALHLSALLVISFATLVSGSAFLYFAPYLHRYQWITWFTCAVMLFSGCLVIGLSYRCAMGVPFDRVLGSGTGIARRCTVRAKMRGVAATTCCMGFFGTPMALWSSRVFSGKFDNAFLHFRDLQLLSGVAPALPVLLLLTIIYLGVWVYLKRLAHHFFGNIRLIEMADHTGEMSHFGEHASAVDEWLLNPPRGKYWSILLVATLGTVLAFRPWATMDTFELGGVEWVMIFCGALAYFGLMVNWFRFIGVWHHLRKILGDIERLPLRAAFSRLPKVSTSPIWGWRPIVATTDALEMFQGLARVDPSSVPESMLKRLKECTREFERVAAGSKAEGVEIATMPPMAAPVPLARASGESRPLTATSLGTIFTKTETVAPLATLTTPTGGRTKAALNSCRERKLKKENLRKAMDEAIKRLLIYLTPYWNRGMSGLPKELETIDPGDSRFFLAENLVARRFYNYIRYVVTEMRRILFFTVAASTLLFLALHLYAFQALRSIDYSFIVLFLFLGSGVIWVLAQMERDPLLSRLQGNEKPGKLTRNFYLDVVRYGLVPVLTLVSSQVPQISNLLLGWLKPNLDALR